MYISAFVCICICEYLSICMNVQTHVSTRMCMYVCMIISIHVDFVCFKHSSTHLQYHTYLSACTQMHTHVDMYAMLCRSMSAFVCALSRLLPICSDKSLRLVSWPQQCAVCDDTSARHCYLELWPIAIWYMYYFSSTPNNHASAWAHNTHHYMMSTDIQHPTHIVTVVLLYVAYIHIYRQISTYRTYRPAHA